MREFEIPVIEVKPIDVADEITTSTTEPVVNGQPGDNGLPIG